MNDLPEINFTLKTVKVEVKTRPLRTIRDVRYKGFIGKLKTMWGWAMYNSDDSFSEYLNRPVTYTRELPEHIETYLNYDGAEAELIKMLEEEE